MSPSFPITFINVLFEILKFALIARIILSWIRTPMSGPLFKFLIDVTQPILDLARRITPKTGMIDLSPLIALFGLDIIRWIIFSILIY